MICSSSSVDEFVNIISDVYKDRLLLIFIAPHYGNFPTIEYLSYSIRKDKSTAVFAVYLSNPPADSSIFTNVFDCNKSLEKLVAILKLLPDIPIYIQAHAKWVFLGAFVKSLLPEHRVIQEVYDWMSFFIAEDRESTIDFSPLFTQNEMRMMRFYEGNFHDFIDGLVYKGGDFPNKKRMLEKSIPAIQMYPCPPFSWAQKPSCQLNASNIPRLVFAGQVKNKQYLPEFFGDLYYIPVIKSLTQQELSVSVYASHARDERQYQAQFSDYLNEAEVNPLFEMHKRMPVRSLIRELSIKYDYGLLIHYFPNNLKVGKKHLETALASKLFTYLMAGLPVLVSEELEFMANWVEKHEVGLVISQSQISSLADILKTVNYEVLCKNVRKVQNQKYLEKSMDEIYALLFPET